MIPPDRAKLASIPRETRVRSRDPNGNKGYQPAFMRAFAVHDASHFYFLFIVARKELFTSYYEISIKVPVEEKVRL
jgi:hypothetical protein